MKAKVKTKELKLALAKLSSLPGGSSGLASNSIVVIDADEFGGLRLSRTTVHAMARITCEAEIEESGTAPVPYDALGDAITACEGEEIEFSLTATELHISAREGEGSVKLQPQHEVIPMPPKLEGVEICFKHDELITTLKIASSASSNDRSRPQLLGVCFRKVSGALSIFGCNGHRAHVSRIAALIGRIDPEANSERDYGILLPTEGVQCVLKVFGDEKSPCMVTLGKHGVQFDAGEICVRLPVAEDRTPFVEPLLNPVAEIKWKVQKAPFLSAVKAVSPTSGDGAINVRLERNLVSLRTTSATAKVERNVACESDGTGEYNIESKYLIAMLQWLELDWLDMTIVARGQRLHYREGERDFLIMFRAGSRYK